jgi:hypothetical protein
MVNVACVAVPLAETRGESERAIQHQRMPMIDAIRAYGASGAVPFSTPGHKLGLGLDDDLRHLLGDQFCAADVWLNTGDYDRALRRAEDLAAETWGAQRSFFLVNAPRAATRRFCWRRSRPEMRWLWGATFTNRCSPAWF